MKLNTHLLQRTHAENLQKCIEHGQNIIVVLLVNGSDLHALLSVTINRMRASIIYEGIQDGRHVPSVGDIYRSIC